MILEKTLMPDEMYDTFEDVTPEHLISLGRKFIFCDIDNTLATYDDPTPPESVVNWCRRMNEAGITVSFVSNNNKDRVDLFNKDLGYIAYSKAHKPMTKKLKCAMRDAGAAVENSALLGDQLLTDAAAANSAGLYCIIVPPIKDKTNAFFRFKRWIEKPYVKKFKEITKTK
ncbi:MAG: YqeG family HAD IIIA-type phosphatase [Ruminococcaceae bacterium]|nr:YqeG family HAD IIIA-type phosphatase [Oscillospiraceae bacterium]